MGGETNRLYPRYEEILEWLENDEISSIEEGFLMGYCGYVE